MIDWWQALNTRERGLVLSAGFVALAGLLFVFLLEPLAKEQQLLDTRLRAEQSALSRIEDYASEAIKIRSRMDQGQGRAADKSKSMLSLLNQSASKHALQNKVKRIVPNGADKASVVFDEVVFDDFTAWLIDLQSNHGIIVDRITVDREREAGIVRANVNLKR